MVEQNTVNICVECSIHSKGYGLEPGWLGVSFG